MIQPQLSVQQWVTLSPDVRLKLVRLFKIPKSEGSVIRDNALVSDGHNYKDLQAITVDAMQSILMDTVENDFFRLFERVLASLEVENNRSVEDHVQKVEQENIARWMTLLMDMRQRATELNLLTQFNELVEKTLNINLVNNVASSVAKEVARGRPKKHAKPL